MRKRTYTNIPEPRYVERAKHADNVVSDGLISLERLGDYLFEATFADIPQFKDTKQQYVAACTSFVKNGKLYRNLDFNYDEMATFHVICKGFEGMAFIRGVNDDGELDSEKLGQLPYHLLDGKNDAGIMVSTHLLYNDWQYKGNGEKNVPLYRIPYEVLTRLTTLSSAASIQTALTDVLSNIAPRDDEYLLQFLVTDGTNTYVIVPPEASTGAYQIIKAAEGVEKMTNFRYVGTATLARDAEALQKRPMGVERWNLIESGATLEDLRYTQAYISDDRLSEFIGINETDKNSTDEELEAIYDIAHDLYLERTRNGYTWHTLYSVVYTPNGIESLFAQENYEHDYISHKKSGGTLGVVIQSDSDETVSDVTVPSLTADQVTNAYNALAAGNSCTIVNADGELQYKAVMGDAATGYPSVLIPYYWLAWVDYQVNSDDNVTITVHKIPELSNHQITSVTVGSDTIDIVIS